MPAVALLSLLLGCGGTADVETPGAPPIGWLADAARDPAAFDAMVTRTGRAGWIAFHSNDLIGSIGAFPGGSIEVDRSRARAELAMGVLHADLAAVAHGATDRLFTSWERRGGLPADSGAAVVAALSARCAGQAWKAWADKVPAAHPASPFAVALADDATLWPAEDATSDQPLVKRRILHAQARAGRPEGLLQAAREPVLSEAATDFTREFYDPCYHDTLATFWLDRAGRSVGGEGWKAAAQSWAAADAGLAGTLFAPWLTAADLEAEIAVAPAPGLLGATSPSLSAAGIAAPAGADEVDPARDQARALDALLDRWREQLLADANDDGDALITDLRLIDRFRQDWLLARARHALAERRPRQALAYAQLARDVSAGIGPANSPAVFAVLAAAELENGHTREALDALGVLSEAHPEVYGLVETVGDLAVLEGLDRRGDSKEN